MVHVDHWELIPLSSQNWSSARPWHFTSRKLFVVNCSLSETQKMPPTYHRPAGPKYPIRNWPRTRSAQVSNSYFSQQWQDIRTAARTSWIHHLHQTGTFRRQGDLGEIQLYTRRLIDITSLKVKIQHILRKWRLDDTGLKWTHTFTR